MASSADILRVATFNIRNGLGLDGLHCWPLRRRQTLDALAGLDADVVGLQEAYGFQRRWLASKLSVRSVGSGRSRRRRNESCPILVAPELVVRSSSTRWLSDTPDQPGSRWLGAAHPRVLTLAELEWQGHNFVVANTHLSAHSSQRRRQGAELIAHWLNPEVPTVLLGDFNAAASDPLFAPLLASGLTLLTPASGRGTFHGFTGISQGPAIDHILVSPHWDVSSCSVVEAPAVSRYASDHWPLQAELRLRPD
ncbi:MAG: Endonuclease/exonuclease/phosphatase [Acidimicrobiia bacterium]|nr:Endonuclease/exonuclease/phosphatase [Acidimicrobiia bacterium]